MTVGSSVWAPFHSRDFTFLYLTNIAEFFATTLSRLSALQQLYEATGDGRALGALGIVTLLCQVPSIALGGVLADTFQRCKMVSYIQAAAALVGTIRWLLCWTSALTPGAIYVTVGLLEICARTEASARSSILPAVVDESVLPNAVSLVSLTQYAGEIAAPFIFWALADMSGTLTPSFAAAALSFAAAAGLPRLIRADTNPTRREGAAALPRVTAVGRGVSTSLQLISGAWLAGLQSMVEGVRYIMRHPLLPGLYALDWGFTCVSFYRELFPLWVGVWLTMGVPAGLSQRGEVAMLVVANFAGGMAGSAATLAMNSYPYKGRLVVYATAFYGVACFTFGCSQQLWLGATAVFCMGAADAVGATMRKQVVLLSTPDNLRGRAQSGHQMAAYVANSIGQVYVAFMVSQIGAGLTMQLGGVVTELMTGLSAWRIPALLTYPRTPGTTQRPSAGTGSASQPSSKELSAVADPSTPMAQQTQQLEGPDDDAADHRKIPWSEMNDAAREAATAAETQRRAA